jgi:hypothetical protein
MTVALWELISRQFPAQQYRPPKKIISRISIKPEGQPVRILKQKTGKKDSTGGADVTENRGCLKSSDKKQLPKY